MDKAEPAKLGMEDEVDAQDHEPMAVEGYHVERDGTVVVEVSMESQSKRWINYKTKVDVKLLWEDCKDEDENLVLMYAHALDMKNERKELFDKIASLAQKPPTVLFPTYSNIYKHDKEDPASNDEEEPCCIQHAKKFIDTEYQEDPSVYYFLGQRKWSGKTCYNCNDVFVDVNNKSKKAMLPVYVCKHYCLEKGDCTSPFLCANCYKHKVLNNDSGGRNRRSRGNH